MTLLISAFFSIIDYSSPKADFPPKYFQAFDTTMPQEISITSTSPTRCFEQEDYYQHYEEHDRRMLLKIDRYLQGGRGGYQSENNSVLLAAYEIKRIIVAEAMGTTDP